MRNRAILGILALLVVAAPGARADKKADIAAIKALYAKLQQGMRKKDMKAIMESSTPDFTMTESGQTLNAKQAEQQMKQNFATTKSIEKMDMKFVKIDVKGNTATVVTQDTVAMTMLDPQVKGKTHKMVGTGKATATLVKQNGKWLFKKVVETEQQMSMDGKGMPAMAPATPPSGAAAGAGGAPKPHGKK